MRDHLDGPRLSVSFLQRSPLKAMPARAASRARRSAAAGVVAGRASRPLPGAHRAALAMRMVETVTGSISCNVLPGCGEDLKGNERATPEPVVGGSDLSRPAKSKMLFSAATRSGARRTVARHVGLELR
jgi:hypothetical protein